VRKLAAALAVTGAAIGAFGVAAPANASTNPYNPDEICGSNYHNIDHHDFKTGNGVLMATTYLEYNGGTDCVVTLNRTGILENWDTGATIQVSGKSAVTDRNNYTYYAGPVRGYAPGACIKWGGHFDEQNWTSDWSHCG
jgi:hypothetical protein